MVCRHLFLLMHNYIDELSNTLNDAKAGCMMNGVFYHFTCADDLKLV